VCVQAHKSDMLARALKFHVCMSTQAAGEDRLLSACCLHVRLTLEGTSVRNSAGIIWSVSMFYMGSHQRETLTRAKLSSLTSKLCVNSKRCILFPLHEWCSPSEPSL